MGVDEAREVLKLARNNVFQHLIREFLAHYYSSTTAYSHFDKNLQELIQLFEDENCRIAPLLSETEKMSEEEREALRLLKKWADAIIKPYETYAYWGALRKCLKVKIPSWKVWL